MIGHSVKVIYRKNRECAGSAPSGELILWNQIEENATISNVQLEWQPARAPVHSVWKGRRKAETGAGRDSGVGSNRRWGGVEGCG